MPPQPKASDLATAAVQYKIDVTSLSILLNFSTASLILSTLSVLPVQLVLGDHYTYGVNLFDDSRGLYTQPSTDESRLLLKLFDDSRGTLVYTQLSTDESRLLLLHHSMTPCNVSYQQFNI